MIVELAGGSLKWGPSAHFGSGALAECLANWGAEVKRHFPYYPSCRQLSSGLKVLTDQLKARKNVRFRSTGCRCSRGFDDCSGSTPAARTSPCRGFAGGGGARLALIASFPRSVSASSFCRREHRGEANCTIMDMPKTTAPCLLCLCPGVCATLCLGAYYICRFNRLARFCNWGGAPPAPARSY